MAVLETVSFNAKPLPADAPSNEMNFCLALQKVLAVCLRNAEKFRVELLKMGREMKAIIPIKAVTFLLAGALILSAGANAQQRVSTTAQNSRAYELSREVSLQGTVVEYRASSSTPPLGAHVTLQTASGTVDVHLGNPQLLTASHFSLATGDTVRIIGENFKGPQGNQFVARILQKGTQAITVRSLQGIPLKPGHANGAQAQKQQGGVL